ncbi:MAG: fibronectin type III domain-containing protein [Elusimicrobia bacterium]|nr:fibronectin type III domain-containing protein [Elusimicrobiota bacterium]
MALSRGMPRKSRTAAAIAGAVFFAAASALASAPILTPEVLQCDGSFAAGANTSHPAPTIRVAVQSADPGLKIGQRRLSVLPAVTNALWRFDGNYDVSISSCYANGCDAGTVDCQTALWRSTSTNGSTALQVGRCAYDCGGALNAEPTDQVPVQLGACPGTVAAVASTLANSAAGPLAGEASLGLSSTALSLNGATYATAPDATTWNLPASYTLAAWIKTNDANGGNIVSQQSATKSWGIGVSASGGLRHFDSRDGVAGSTESVARSGSVALNNDSWHLVHLVRRNGIDRRFYIDGALISTTVASSSSSFASHPIGASLEIGRAYDGTLFLGGTLDDVRIVNTTLSDDEIRLEWDAKMHKYSSNSGVAFSTSAGSYSGSPANGTTAVVYYSTAGASPAQPYAANSRWLFMAQSIDGESSQSATYVPSIDQSPPIAPAVTGVALSTGDIAWSWGVPSRVCLPPAGFATIRYRLFNASGSTALNPPGNLYPDLVYTEPGISGSPNQLVGRRLRVDDNWGAGLSAATSVYTWAEPPLAGSVVPSAISTSAAWISWNQNGNPAYTRYLLNLSTVPAFAAGVSTPTTLDSGFTGSSVALTGLSAGTTYYVRVQAYSGRAGDVFVGVPTVYVSTSLTTLPGPPALTGLALSNASIQWDWTAVPGAQYYKLFDADGSTLYTGAARSFTQAGLAINTQHAASVEAISIGGGGARSGASAFTWANDPISPVVGAAGANSITYSWNANDNPSYTFYEVGISAEPDFSTVLRTLTVSTTNATADSLFPGTSYYARLRSINGDQREGALVAIATASTLSNAALSATAAPPSPYVPPDGAVGQWQFDENAGLAAADSSGFGNAAALVCVSAACSSTPTFAAGPAGLGSAVSLTGVDNGLVRVPDSVNYDFNDDLTVSAWVNPSSLSQPGGAGIVVRGNGGVENFALDASGGLYRFMPKPGTVASSTNSISVGVWTHLIGVYDFALGSATLYVNGRPASTALLAPSTARTAAAHDISIGNRQSAAAAYDRGFIGRIDSVRVQHRALSAAEALAEYQGNFTSTITPASPNGAILIGLPPGAFGAPATLFVSIDPFTNPIAISPSVLNAGLTVIPTGHTLVPNSIVEIVPVVAGAAFTQTLGSSASISMPYADADGDNIIDGSSPQLAASAIRVYTLNTLVNRWELLPSFLDPSSRRVTALTPHFSVFGMFAPVTVGASLSEARVYPVPWRPGSLGRFDAAGVTFDRLPASGTIRILNLAGERVREFTFGGAAAGAVEWNGLTDGGRRAASGVYFARITAPDGSASIVKFAIER